MKKNKRDETTNGLSRRRFLTTTAVAGIGSTVAISNKVSATARRKRILAQSRQILRETDSIEKQHEYLRDHGFGVVSDRHVYSMPSGSSGSDGVSAQSRPVETVDLDISLSLYTDLHQHPVYTAELAFQYEFDAGEWGEHPWDVAGIGWDSARWNYNTENIPDDTYAYGPTTIAVRGETARDGPAFNVDDAHLSSGTSEFYTCGVDIVPHGNYGTYDRLVYGGFTHTWNDVTITGMSVGYYGIYASVSNKTEAWRTRTEKDGDLLQVTQAEATNL